MPQWGSRIAVACALTMALVGCTPTPAPPDASTQAAIEAKQRLKQDHAALDTYVEAERSTIPAILEATPGKYSEVTIDGVYPGTVVYRYVYADVLDPALVQDSFESLVPSFQTMCDTTVFPAMESAGVPDPQKMTFSFFNLDGSPLWSKTFEAQPQPGAP